MLTFLVDSAMGCIRFGVELINFRRPAFTVCFLLLVAGIALFLRHEELADVIEEDKIALQIQQATLQRQIKRYKQKFGSGKETEVNGTSQVEEYQYRWIGEKCPQYAKTNNISLQCQEDYLKNSTSTCLWWESQHQRCGGPGPCTQLSSGSFHSVAVLRDDTATADDAAHRLLSALEVDAHFPHSSEVVHRAMGSNKSVDELKIIKDCGECAKTNTWANAEITTENAHIHNGEFVTHAKCESGLAHCDNSTGSSSNGSGRHDPLNAVEVLAILRKAFADANPRSFKGGEEQEGAAEDAHPMLLMSGDSMLRQLFMRFVAIIRGGVDGKNPPDPEWMIEHYFHCDAVYTIFDDGDEFVLLYNTASPLTHSEPQSDDSDLLHSVAPFDSIKQYFLQSWNAIALERTKQRNIVFQVHFLWDPDQESSRLLQTKWQNNTGRYDSYELHIHSFGYFWINGYRIRSPSDLDSTSIERTFLEPFQKQLMGAKCAARKKSRRPCHVILVGMPLLPATHNSRAIYDGNLKKRDLNLLRWCRLMTARQRGLIDARGDMQRKRIMGGPDALDMMDNSPGDDNQGSFVASFVDFNGISELFHSYFGGVENRASYRLRCDGTHFMCSFVPRAPNFNYESSGIKTERVQHTVCDAPRCRDDVNFSLWQWIVQLQLAFLT